MLSAQKRVHTSYPSGYPRRLSCFDGFFVAYHFRYRFGNNGQPKRKQIAHSSKLFSAIFPPSPNFFIPTSPLDKLIVTLETRTVKQGICSYLKSKEIDFYSFLRSQCDFRVIIQFRHRHVVPSPLSIPRSFLPFYC